MATGFRAQWGVVLAVLTPAMLAACGDSNQYVAPPPPKVGVAVPLQQPVTRYLEATGNTAAVNSANLVARVQGFVQSIDYKDGDLVKKDATLFVIEPEPYRLRQEQAKAAESGAQASLTQAQAEFDRQSELRSKQVATQTNFDKAVAERDSAKANLLQAQSNTSQADINYGYTQVKAPFDGMVTARRVSVGELVGAGTPTVLASIVQVDPIYVNFNLSEKDILIVREDMQRRGQTLADLKKIPIEIGLQTDTEYPHAGTLDYAAPTVNQSTGTLLVRGIFENAKRVLLPGYFVRVRVPASAPAPALLVPDTALGSDQGGRYLLVVNQDDVVEQRKVEIGPVVGGLRVIESGLKPDDRVAVGGAIRAVPGQKVVPQLQTISAEAVGSK